MDLYAWPGIRGIDSFDTDCLVVLTYLRLGKCRINLNPCKDFSKESIQTTPLLVHGNNKITGVSNILDYLRKENYGLEYDLSDEERTRLDSLIASVERRIAPACRWLLWADADVYQSYTSPLYRSRLPHFQGLWYPRWWRNKLIESAEYSQLALCAGRIKSKNRYREVETTLYEGARRCLTALSYVLGNKQFFLGERPSAIDAYVFGRIWPLLNYDRTCRLVSGDKNASRLVSYVYQCDNLLKLCRRVQRICFPSANNTFRSSATELVEMDDTKEIGRWWFSSLFPGITANIPSILPAFLVPYREVLLFGALSLALFGTFAVVSGFIGFEEEESHVDGEGVDYDFPDSGDYYADEE